jgi:light-regulated signal transduction histidine kinase (bacteriophytochrome)
MSQADRLFGAFRRSHKDSEFQGAGIGLATIDRIIRRHSGRIWAEVKLSAARRFIFTLPQEGKQ